MSEQLAVYLNGRGGGNAFSRRALGMPQVCLLSRRAREKIKRSPSQICRERVQSGRQEPQGGFARGLGRLSTALQPGRTEAAFVPAAIREFLQSPGTQRRACPSLQPHAPTQTPRPAASGQGGMMDGIPKAWDAASASKTALGMQGGHGGKAVPGKEGWHGAPALPSQPLVGERGSSPLLWATCSEASCVNWWPRPQPLPSW